MSRDPEGERAATIILSPTAAELDAWLGEDVPMADLTTEAFGIAARPATMRFAARGDMVVAGGIDAVAAAAAQVVAGGDPRVICCPNQAPPRDVRVTFGPA